MKLARLEARNYRSLRDVSVELGGGDVFIGANGSGKSAILDTLRFLHESVQARDFQAPLSSRGGLLHLAWKGEEARRVSLVVVLEDDDRTYEWSVSLIRDGLDTYVEERLEASAPGAPPSILLHSDRGEGWWWSKGEDKRVALRHSPTACALTAASANASFPARGVAEFVGQWGFFDPNPFLLRRDWAGLDAGRFDPYGRNLAETLYRLSESSPDALDRIVEASRSVVGLPQKIEPRESEGGYYFVQNEPGLQYRVHQMGVSSGTLRMLALMTALYGRPEANLIGIEEPENYVHPTALSAFVEHLRDGRGRGFQFVVTTHSPLLLDCLDEPSAVSLVRRGDAEGTIVQKQDNPDGVREALVASGFGLGEFYETKGFGS